MDGLEIETVEVTPDAKGNVSVAVPEGMTPPPAAPAELSFKAGDLQSDLAKIAAESGAVQPDKFAQQNPPVATEPVAAVEPEQPATAPATPVPDKFKNPDGTVNEEKVAKSTLNAEQALAQYAEVEKKLRQKQNEVAALKNSPAPAQQPQVQNFNLTPFERQAAIDILNDAQALGIQITEQQAILQARSDIRMAEAKHRADLSVTADLRERIDLQDRNAELKAIAKSDPWVFSPEGIAKLESIRTTRNTPTWTAAYREHLADEAIQQRLSGQVENPTPTARTAKAPPTPVNAAQRVVVKPSEPVLQSKEQVDAYVSTLTPAQEKEFWAKKGLRF